jgi:rhomboid protease GluP
VFKRQTSGSVICTSCGVLVGVSDPVCYNCNRRNPGLWGFAPAFRRLGQDLGFVPLVMGGTITLFAVSLLLSGLEMQTMLSPSTRVLVLLGASGAYPVFGMDRWWTVLTAGWLHAGVLHIFFNALWIRQLAPTIAELYGPGRMVIVYTVAGIVGFTFSSVAGRFIGFLPIIGGAQLSVGASAPIFGRSSTTASVPAAATNARRGCNTR